MNYEQKYNEVLQKAKEEYNRLGELGNESMKRSFEIIFPELRESEDERIRKTLIHIVKGACDKYGIKYRGEEISEEKLLAYLEKQKERGPLTKEEEYTLHRIIEYLEDETCPSEWISLLHDIYCLPYGKQKEQKPNLEQIKRSWYMEGYTDGEFKREPMWNLVTGKGGPRYEKNEKYGQPLEQKVWSDEDENTLKYLHELIGDGYDRKIMAAQTAIDMKEWLNTKLKSLRPQPKQEWSEEDCIKQRALIDTLRGETACFTTNDFISWLKSLRPQYHGDVTMTEAYKMGLEAGKASSWKPSPEQIYSLGTVVKGIGESSFGVSKNLRELYEQLKALM